VVQAYTLGAERASPAVSLYVTYDEATLDVLAKETRLERVQVAINFRHDRLDHIVTEDWINHRSASFKRKHAPALAGQARGAHLFV